MKKNKFSKLIVLIVIMLNVGFAAAVLYVNLRGGIVPDSLIIAWFGFTTGELWMLVNIKKNKIKKEKRIKNYESELETEINEP